MSPFQSRRLKDDIIIHEEDVIDCICIHIFNHSPGKPTATTEIPIMNDGETIPRLFFEGTAVVDDEDVEPVVILLKFLQHIYSPQNVFFPLEGTNADADLLFLPAIESTIISAAGIGRTIFQRRNRKAQNVCIDLIR